ncbi:SDR family oxidoreductase [Dyadobacter frigoris]|uniref:SDR family oxidoreductase n=1 Tax=Dyadobacter frigoris TaxID=2576211 RepID=A0A4U6D9D4_9BACT|nr:SDR family oxidoreductase [Dyadobacter frigoris]TKT94132.1 SDR family oxidoreductase [Dyadobacter frigoris]GLU50657.1 oxidoreductase [Dyadobacter frigoris]
MKTYNTHASLSISGKVILVTGAYGLIGQTIASAFLEQGAFVILADIDKSKQNMLESEISKKFPASHFLFQTLDIADKESCQQTMIAIIQKFGRLDVLINNAGLDAKFDQESSGKVNHSRFENYPIDLLRKAVEINLTGTILITQYACKQMIKQQSGNIINVASTYSIVSPNQNLYDFRDGNQNFKPVDYVASKSFVPNFTRYLATFYAREGIRCNAIVPHGIYNNHEEPFLQNFARLSPLGRMCDREELIGPFTFLASDASGYMTGSLLTVDGGWTAW